jgi:hypothetical protein
LKLIFAIEIDIYRFMKKIITLIILITFASSSCEKDDICDANTPTTPRLIIDFYNVTNPTIKKNVTNLKVIGEGMKDGIIFSAGAGAEAQYLTNGTSIALPLKTNANATKYRFILNSGNPNPALIDTDEITINYTRNDIYVSRACGYKTLFMLQPTNSIIQTAVPTTNAKWMRNIAVEKTNIDNENETHVKIFF